MADKTKTELETEAARSIAVLLPGLDEGRFNASVSEALKNLVADMRNDAAARAGSSKGELKIALTLKLDSGVFTVKADYAVKAPKETFGKTIFWANDGNNLVDADPRQERLPFGKVRQVADAPEQIRKV